MEYSHGYGATFEICELYGRSKASEAAVRLLITLMIKVELRPCDQWQPKNARPPSTGRPWRHHGPWSMDHVSCLMSHVSCRLMPNNSMTWCNAVMGRPGSLAFLGSGCGRLLLVKLAAGRHGPYGWALIVVAGVGFDCQVLDVVRGCVGDTGSGCKAAIAYVYTGSDAGSDVIGSLGIK